MPPIERNETYTKWEQDAITMLLLHLCALLICLYLEEMGYAEDTAPVIFVLAVFLTGFFTNGYLWSLLGSLLSVFVVNYFFTEPFSKLSFSGPDAAIHQHNGRLHHRRQDRQRDGKALGAAAAVASHQRGAHPQQQRNSCADQKRCQCQFGP